MFGGGGSEKWKLEPDPSWLSTLTVPPAASVKVLIQWLRSKNAWNVPSGLETVFRIHVCGLSNVNTHRPGGLPTICCAGSITSFAR